MFFPERIKGIKTNDKILEIGPGGTPHPRSDVFLEKLFNIPDEARGQRGHAAPLKTDKQIVFYDGDKFPFNDDEFDYVICSHVLEHVEDIDNFVREINRVSKKGYIEYPTIYYDYIYNFPEHKTLLLRKNNVINWMLKKDTYLDQFRNVNAFFYQSLTKGFNGIIEDLKDFLFEGFEWFDSIETNHVTEVDLVCYNLAEIHIPQNQMVHGSAEKRSVHNITKIISKLFRACP
jgi:SAM-dependent methyltransferase